MSTKPVTESHESHELSEADLERLTTPDDSTGQKADEKPVEAKVEVDKVVEQATKPAPQQPVETTRPQGNGHHSQQTRPQQGQRPQQQQQRPQQQQQQDRRPATSESVGNRIKGLERPEVQAIATSTDEVKKLELRLKAIESAKGAISDLIRIWNAGDREFAKQLFAFMKGE